ncbi:MAG: hypothetical protein KAS85_00575 [Rhodobacteraceae bacterium]|nr:hypothetical protein [Paracoccaceae bacterium]
MDRKIWEGVGWVINANMTYSIPGYMYVTHKSITEFANLSQEDSSELGLALKLAAQAAEKVLSPENVLVGRFGVVPGHNIHFHITPVYDWVKAALLSDPKYTAYQASNPEGYPAIPDGAELQAYIWREMHMRKTRFIQFDHEDVADKLEKFITENL